MRQRIVIGALLILGLASPARAELGFFRWWDSLSGPGPFSGVVVDPVLACYGTSRLTDKQEWKPLWRCWDQKRDKLRVNVGLEWARLTGPNNLPYAAQDGQFGAELTALGLTRRGPDVRAYPFMVTATVSRDRIFEFGAGVGFVRFSGEGFGFNRFAVEPRLTAKPFARLGPKYEFLLLHLIATAIPGEFKAADFGAVGNWSSKGELLPGFMVEIDVLPLVSSARR